MSIHLRTTKAGTSRRTHPTAHYLAARLSAAVFAMAIIPPLLAQTANLLHPINIEYVGAFRLDQPTGPGHSTWEYSNGPIAYYPNGDSAGANDGFPGSLFIAGHVYESRVAELSIPVPVKSRNLNQLPTARILQPMTHVTGTITTRNGFIMGMTYVAREGRIYFTHGQDYSDSDCDASSGTPPGLGSFAPTLSNPQTQGLWFLDKNGTRLHPFTSLRYIMEIPQGWADSRLDGRSLATGRHRGWCPEGTNLYSSAPWASGSSPAPGSNVPTSTLMQFGQFSETSKWSKDHSSANAYQGAAWLTAGEKSAVVISGIIDYDNARSYYGYDNWKLPNQCDPNPEANGCTGGRGWRAADPRAALLFYNPDDLAAVAAGRKQSWTPEWYARLDIEQHMLRNYPPTYMTTGADAETILPTYDRARGLLYVTESFADGPKPVVHVFRVTSTRSPAVLPPAPGNLHLIR
jgi:hypothetical protein